MTFRANGANIRALRQLRGWSQTDLAKAITVTVSHISRVESGERDMSIKTLHRVAEALSVPIGALLTVVEIEESIVA